MLDNGGVTIRSRWKPWLLRLVPIVLLAVYYCYLATRVGLDSGGSAGPDEIARMLVPKAMLNGKLIPSGYDPDTILGWGNYSYAFYPQMLGSYVTAACMAFARVFGAAPLAQLYAARMSSVLWGLVGACCVGSTVSTLILPRERSQEYGAIATLFIGFWPQYAFLSAYVNNDIVGLAGVSILVYALVKGVKNQWNFKNSALLVAGIVICALGYLNTYGFILAGIVVFVTSCVSQNRENRRRALTMIGLSAAACAILTFPFYAVNIARYGDVIGSRAFQAQYDKWISDGGEPLMVPYSAGAFNMLFRDSRFVRLTTKSFIGFFGYITSPLPDVFIFFFRGSLLVGTALFFCNRPYVRSAFSNRWRLFTVSMIVATLITVCLHIWRSVTTDFQPQGRYIIDILVPWCIVAVLGFTGSSRKTSLYMWLFIVVYVAACVVGMSLAMKDWPGLAASPTEWLTLVIP